MEAHVVKFLRFLEDKEGQTVSSMIKLLNPNKFKITKDDLDVTGDLDLSESDITSLPDGLKVSGDLDLYGCTSLTTLPDYLYVGGDLNLTNCTLLTTLPNRLHVRWGLFLGNTPLAEMYSIGEIQGIIEANGGYVRGITTM